MTPEEVTKLAVKESEEELGGCPDCAAHVGEQHTDHCDVERCPDCGGQMLSCNCDGDSDIINPRIPWSGLWPGVAECRAYGLWSYFTQADGWVTCDKDHPKASEDLNSIYDKCVWSPERQHWVLKGLDTEKPDVDERTLLLEEMDG